MTADLDDGADPSARRGPRSGELLVAAVIVGIGALSLVGAVVMDVPDTAGFLGPRFFPALIGAALLALGLALAARELRGSSAAEEPAGSPDWKPLGLVAATLVLHLLLLDVLGWILAGTALFWGISYALGSRSVLRDLAIALVVAAAVQLGFSAGLGLNLPGGVLLGVI
ncbi:tripartite tricarboxylate transporter TctB family protein [Saccharopolyspora sp. HNM0983]|uniref:Tripartite tricarboxylate transporter TctB family protein n=1 Tax=Saccharopolyspora montiporae TaxID=2781240 RepID=A0A929BAW7_9PSEU|nr:tripartite tricarboxylate transporter TctB family protein [Saccharopolyspora sp. HNM0983]MBE9375405.1 tripartite tricarboxylate transporter TctB family protein [Saccharopolyspora sp. HNM0983]